MDADYSRLSETRLNSMAGMKILKHFFDDVRLKTNVGKYGTMEDWIASHKDKPYIQRFVAHSVSVLNRTEPLALRKAFEIYSGYGSIRMFRPMIATFLIDRFHPKSILDPCAGWGGRCLGAMARNVNYTGYDTNLSLIEPYAKMREFVGDRTTSEVILCSVNSTEQSIPADTYDMVLTSPPYWKTNTTLIETYEHMPEYVNEADFNERFLFPMIEKTYTALKRGGAYCISTDVRQYQHFKLKLGEPTEQHSYPRQGRTTNIAYGDFIYVWVKT